MDGFAEDHSKKINEADKMIKRVSYSNKGSNTKGFLNHIPNQNLNLTNLSNQNNNRKIDNMTDKTPNINNTSPSGNHNKIIVDNNENNDNNIKPTTLIAVHSSNQFIDKTQLNLIEIESNSHNNNTNNLNSKDTSRKNKYYRRKKSLYASNSILQNQNLFKNNNNYNNKSSKEKNEYLNNQKAGDSSNLEYLNQEQKDLCKLNLIKDNHNARPSEKDHISTAGKSPQKAVSVVEGKNLSIFRLMCIDAFRMRKKSSPKKLGFYYFYFNKLIECYDKKFDVFNYLKICEEFENMKDIVFDDYKIEFAKIRPVFDLDGLGENCERSSDQQNHHSTVNMKKIDRILTNLFRKLQKT